MYERSIQKHLKPRRVGLIAQKPVVIEQEAQGFPVQTTSHSIDAWYTTGQFQKGLVAVEGVLMDRCRTSSLSRWIGR